MTTVATYGSHATVEERETALREIAELVSDEDRRGGPLGPVLTLIVPALAGAACLNPLERFAQLVEATAQRSAFLSDEPGWLARHDYPASITTRLSMFDRLQAEVDECAARLMGRTT